MIQRLRIWLASCLLPKDAALFTPTALWQHDEEIKRDFLDRGYQRGLTADRPNLPFSLILRRQDEADPIRRQAQSSAGVSPSTLTYSWWACADAGSGREICIGTLAEHPTAVAAVVAYGKLMLDAASDPLLDPVLMISEQKRKQMMDQEAARLLARDNKV